AAIKLNPEDPYCYNNRGVAYHKKGEYETAIHDFSRAIELNPGYAKAYQNRGEAHQKLGHRMRAFLDFYEAEKLQRDE
ncbi:MAG TPA: tetratricopeptide repeat protein, partial [Vicinamibacterales bacterium]|nr:tetratricopeptide repeat protein [Vicinamibacterales bacterium]